MLNNVSLVGRLTRDLDLRYTNSNKATVSFSLAVEQDYADQNGKRNADFPTCVVWNKAAENLANLAHKGTMMSVTGRLSTRNYEDKNGNRVYVTEVVVQSYSLIDDYGRGRQNNNGNQSNQQRNFSNNGNSENYNQNQQRNSQNNGNFGNYNQNNQGYPQNNQGNQYQGQPGNNIDLSNLPFADDQGNFRG